VKLLGFWLAKILRLCYNIGMKIIHISNVRLGANLGTGFDNMPSEKARIRGQELLESFYGVLSYAKDNGVKTVLVTGDLFDNTAVVQSLKKEVMDNIAKSKVEVLYLRGARDAKFDVEPEKPKNLRVIDVDNNWTSIELQDNVVVTGIDLFRATTKDNLYDRLLLEKKKYNIVALYGAEDFVQWELLKAKAVDFVALGGRVAPDLKEQKIDSRAKYGYAGGLDILSVHESNTEHGFFVLDIVAGKMTRTFVPVAKRKYETVTVDISGAETTKALDSAVSKKLAKVSKDNILTIELVGQYKFDLQKQIGVLQNKLNADYFSVVIEDKSVLDFSELAQMNDISLRTEFVKTALESGLGQGQIDKIVEYGLRALTGETIEI